MNQSGHYGAALIAYSVVFVIPGWLPHMLSAAGGVTAMVFAQFPDIDHRTSWLKQRGATHTVLSGLLAASVVSIVFWYAGAHVAGTPGSAALAAGLGALTGYGSHLAVDAMTDRGIVPFWPLSERRVALGLFKARNQRVNRLMLFAGVAVLVLAVGGVI